VGYPFPLGQGVDQPHRIPAGQHPELPLEGRKILGLDLDSHLPPQDVDDVVAHPDLEPVAREGVEGLDLRMEGILFHWVKVDCPGLINLRRIRRRGAADRGEWTELRIFGLKQIIYTMDQDICNSNKEGLLAASVIV
jgi:hypothetical protein